MRSCNDLMTMDPTCCLASDPVSRAAQIMKDDDVGSVPVVDAASAKKLVGILTDRDIVIQVVADGKSCADVKVEEIMTKNPVTANRKRTFRTRWTACRSTRCGAFRLLTGAAASSVSSLRRTLRPVWIARNRSKRSWKASPNRSVKPTE